MVAGDAQPDSRTPLLRPGHEPVPQLPYDRKGDYWNWRAGIQPVQPPELLQPGCQLWRPDLWVARRGGEFADEPVRRLPGLRLFGAYRPALGYDPVLVRPFVFHRPRAPQ